MNANPDTVCPVTAAELRKAAFAAEALQTDKVKVLSCHHNGRRPVLLVDRKPTGVEGVLSRRRPDLGGSVHVYSAPYSGVQVEWMERVPAVSGVGHA